MHDALFEYMGDLTRAGQDALARGDVERLGHLFNLSHGCLNACGVSTPTLEAMVHTARAAGALGAKLTGAGNGGAVIALTGGDGRRVHQAWVTAGFQAAICRIGG
jgi:mevalonate kinase